MREIKDLRQYVKRLISDQNVSLEEMINRLYENELSLGDYVGNQQLLRDILARMLLEGSFISKFIDILESDTACEYWYFNENVLKPIYSKEDLLQFV